MAQILVLGLLSGTIYGLFALGIALVYRGTRSINFAQGEIGTLSLFVAWWFVTDSGLPWIVGAVAAIAVAAGIGLAFERFVIRHLGGNRVSIVVATVGLLSLLIATELQFFSASPRELGGPIKGLGWKVAGVFVSPTQVLSILVAAGVVIGLTLFLRRTDFGLGVLAAAQDPDAARLVGVPAHKVAAFVWATGAALSALAALLIEPTIGVFAPLFANELFVKGIVAAVVGGLTSLTGAFLGGLVVGLVEAGVIDVFRDVQIPNVSLVGLFVLVLVILLVRPTGLLAQVRTRGAA